jgi:hypothetical protein
METPKRGPGRPAIPPSDRGAIVPHRLPAGLLDAVNASARALGITPKAAHEQALIMWLASHP